MCVCECAWGVAVGGWGCQHISLLKVRVCTPDSPGCVRGHVANEVVCDLSKKADMLI